MQALQAEDADNSIKFRSKFDQDMSHLLDALNSLNDLVHDRSGQELDVAELPKLCEDVNEVIKALSEITVGKPACENLPALVQQCVQYLQGLLKEDGAVVVEEEEEEEEDTSAVNDASVGILSHGEMPVVPGSSADTGEGVSMEEELPVTSVSAKKRKRPTPVKTPPAAEVSGSRRVKRERVNYAESEEEAEEEQQQQQPNIQV